MQYAVKISSFRFCRSREPVTPGEEPGSQYKFSKTEHFSTWEPVPSMEEPGSPYKIPGACYFQIVGTGFPLGGTGYH